MFQAGLLAGSRPVQRLETPFNVFVVVVTTATIAVVATTAAVLAKPLGDILLKVIKLLVKKTIKKIKEKLGKKNLVESAWQRRKFQRSLKK